jgi:hypothetical protein
MKLLASFILFCLPLLVTAQDNGYLHTRNTMERILATRPGIPAGAMPIMNTAPPEIKGDVYLSKFFNQVVFELYDNKVLVEGYYGKLDLKKYEFDLMTKQGIKTLRGDLVKSFASIDSASGVKSYYINSKGLKGKPINEFFQVLVDGKMVLLKRTELIFKEANFNPALNIGSKDHRYLKKEHLYYLREGELQPLPSKKSIPSLLVGKENAVRDFIKANQLNLGKENHLIKLFEYFNEAG